MLMLKQRGMATRQIKTTAHGSAVKVGAVGSGRCCGKSATWGQTMRRQSTAVLVTQAAFNQCDAKHERPRIHAPNVRSAICSGETTSGTTVRGNGRSLRGSMYTSAMAAHQSIYQSQIMLRMRRVYSTPRGDIAPCNSSRV